MTGLPRALLRAWAGVEIDGREGCVATGPCNGCFLEIWVETMTTTPSSSRYLGQAPEAKARERINSGFGLINKQDLRPVHHSAGQRQQSLPDCSGQIVDEPFEACRQSRAPAGPGNPRPKLMHLAGADPQIDSVERIRNDRKATGGGVAFMVACGIGRRFVATDVDLHEVDIFRQMIRRRP